jgi:hypothetical protein
MEHGSPISKKYPSGENPDFGRFLFWNEMGGVIGD